MLFIIIRFALQLEARFIINDCSGPDSIEYRKHWLWAPFDIQCVDNCVPPRCFNYQNDCPLSYDCGSYSWCSYSYDFILSI
jgi:hypothetical protein